ncbi:hypothetical protein YC2023_082980 [Brassica napus]
MMEMPKPNTITFFIEFNSFMQSILSLSCSTITFFIPSSSFSSLTTSALKFDMSPFTSLNIAFISLISSTILSSVHLKRWYLSFTNIILSQSQTFRK